MFPFIFHKMEELLYIYIYIISSANAMFLHVLKYINKNLSKAFFILFRKSFGYPISSLTNCHINYNLKNVVRMCKLFIVADETIEKRLCRLSYDHN